MKQSNKDVVKGFVDAVSAGDAEGMLSCLADDLTWTFFGSHRFAGTLKGKDELMTGLFAVVGDVLEDGIKVRVNAMVAEGDHVVVEGKGQARSKSGLDYNNDYCLVFELRDGKIQRVRQYLDSELVTRVFGRG